MELLQGLLLRLAALGVLVLVVATATFLWNRRPGRRAFREGLEPGGAVFAAPAFLVVGFFLGGVAMLLGAIYSVWVGPGFAWWALGGFAALALWAAFYWGGVVVCDSTGVTRIRPFGRRTRLAWQDVSEVQPRPLRRDCLLAGAGRTVCLDGLLRPVAALHAILRERLGAEEGERAIRGLQGVPDSLTDRFSR